MTDQSEKINDTAKGNKIVISDTDFLSSFLWRNQFGIVTKQNFFENEWNE